MKKFSIALLVTVFVFSFTSNGFCVVPVDTASQQDAKAPVKQPDAPAGNGAPAIPSGSTIFPDDNPLAPAKGTDAGNRTTASAYIHNPPPTDMTYPEGTTGTMEPDGTVVITHPDGTTVKEETIEDFPVDGPGTSGTVKITTTTNPDGTVDSTYEYPDDPATQPVETTPPVKAPEPPPNGPTTVETAEGTVTTYPNGTVVIVNGNTTTTHTPDGTITTVTNYPDGSVETKVVKNGKVVVHKIEKILTEEVTAPIYEGDIDTKKVEEAGGLV